MAEDVKIWRFLEIDHHVSFGGVLQGMPVELKNATEAVETNRCFFLHLGIATGIHPFILESVLRHYSNRLQFERSEDSWVCEIVSTVNAYAGFVDANCLSFLWLSDFERFRICLLSGTVNNPLISIFASSNAMDAHEDIVIRCNESHFTILRTFDNQQISIDQLLEAAHSQQPVVLCNEVEPSRGRCIAAAMNA